MTGGKSSSITTLRGMFKVLGACPDFADSGSYFRRFYAYGGHAEIRMEHRGYGASAYGRGLVQDSRVSKEKVTWLILSRYPLTTPCMTDLIISLVPYRIYQVNCQ
jgi:hypothetical protein